MGKLRKVSINRKCKKKGSVNKFFFDSICHECKNPFLVLIQAVLYNPLEKTLQPPKQLSLVFSFPFKNFSQQFHPELSDAVEAFASNYIQ